MESILGDDLHRKTIMDVLLSYPNANQKNNNRPRKSPWSLIHLPAAKPERRAKTGLQNVFPVIIGLPP